MHWTKVIGEQLTAARKKGIDFCDNICSNGALRNFILRGNLPLNPENMFSEFGVEEVEKIRDTFSTFSEGKRGELGDPTWDLPND